MAAARNLEFSKFTWRMAPHAFSLFIFSYFTTFICLLRYVSILSFGEISVYCG